jgi:hypothetical protein
MNMQEHLQKELKKSNYDNCNHPHPINNNTEAHLMIRENSYENGTTSSSTVKKFDPDRNVMISTKLLKNQHELSINNQLSPVPVS